MPQSNPSFRSKAQASSNPPVKLRRGRPSTAQSAALTGAIIETATRMFLELGLEGTSMEAVAGALKIPKTTLYNRYSDKRQLAQAVVAHEVKSWSMITSREDDTLPDDLRVRLRHFTTVVLQWTAKPRVRAIVRLASSLSPEHGASPMYAKMRDYLADQIDTYGPKSGIQPTRAASVADALMALIQNRVPAPQCTGADADQTPEERAALIVALLMDGAKAW